MTLKEEVHALVEALDAHSLQNLRERLRLDGALAEAFEDLENGRVLDEGAFLEEVSSRWPARRLEETMA